MQVIRELFYIFEKLSRTYKDNNVMASFNQVVSEVCHAMGRPNDYTFRKTILSALKHEYNEKVRRSYENHKYVDRVLNQRYRVEIIDVPDGDVFATLVNIQYKVKRTAQRVPRPVRLPNNLPFQSVRTVGYNNLVIPFIKESSSQFYKELPGMCALPNYDYINGYIYINGNGNSLIEALGAIVIESPFEHPTEIPIETSDNGKDYPTDDDEWLIPEDMVEQIKETIFKRNFLNVPRVTNEIPVKDDINQNSNIDV